MQDPYLCVVHLLITLGGVLLNFELAGAGVDECEIVLAILGDYYQFTHNRRHQASEARPKGLQLWRHKRTHVRTLSKRN